jgi:hypothetical protein
MQSNTSFGDVGITGGHLHLLSNSYQYQTSLCSKFAALVLAREKAHQQDQLMEP